MKFCPVNRKVICSKACRAYRIFYNNDGVNWVRCLMYGFEFYDKEKKDDK